MGLIDKLKSAASVKELDSVLQQATTYEAAKDETKRRWVRIYKARKHDLTSAKSNKND
jgi:hypothetical protein